MAASGIVPAKPPLPTCSNLPFQPDAGSHTSNLISESLVGLATPRTRQKAGRARSGAGWPGLEGGLKAPAEMEVADVMLASERGSDANLSHERCAEARPGNMAVTNRRIRAEAIAKRWAKIDLLDEHFGIYPTTGSERADYRLRNAASQLAAHAASNVLLLSAFWGADASSTCSTCRYGPMSRPIIAPRKSLTASVVRLFSRARRLRSVFSKPRGWAAC